MVNLKYKAFQIDVLYTKYQKIDRNINIFLALTSSTSIAAWVFWKEFGILWGILIAISQVITVIKPYFPFHKYIKEFGTKSIKLEMLNLEYEKLWNSLQSNKINEQAAAKIELELRRQSLEICRFSDDVIFDLKNQPGVTDRAKKMLSVFLKNNYNVDYQHT
jgi:hypothetical protein